MKVNNYSIYAKYYDTLNVDYSLWHQIIEENLPETTSARKMIEFGCGTGNILEKYSDRFSVYGVDISNAMLTQAKTKIPKGTFYHADMTSFTTEEKFDVALCLFDTINHILNFAKWEDFFQNVASQLSPDGLFIVDANTIARLTEITTYPPMCKEFGNNYFFMKLLQKNETNFLFDVRILSKTDEDLYKEERELIEETTMTGEDIYKKLSHHFSRIIILNEQKERILESEFEKNEKYRWFYICRV